MNEAVLQYLKDDPRFRERVNKNKGIANLLMKKYALLLIPKDRRDDIISDVLNADRYWRMHTADNEELRGKDYNTKDEVEQQKVKQLGY